MAKTRRTRRRPRKTRRSRVRRKRTRRRGGAPGDPDPRAVYGRRPTAARELLQLFTSGQGSVLAKFLSPEDIANIMACYRELWTPGGKPARDALLRYLLRHSDKGANLAAYRYMETISKAPPQYIRSLCAKLPNTAGLAHWLANLAVVNNKLTSLKELVGVYGPATIHKDWLAIQAVKDGKLPIFVYLTKDLGALAVGSRWRAAALMDGAREGRLNILQEMMKPRDEGGVGMSPAAVAASGAVQAATDSGHEAVAAYLQEIVDTAAAA